MLWNYAIWPGLCFFLVAIGIPRKAHVFSKIKCSLPQVYKTPYAMKKGPRLRILFHFFSSLSLMMEYTNKTRRSLRVSTPFSFSSSSYSPSLMPSPSLPTVVQGPCAACKVLRRRCTDTCSLAPYFPPSEQLKFVIAHKVFGASNIVKALQVIQLRWLLLKLKARLITLDDLIYMDFTDFVDLNSSYFNY